MEVGGLVGRSSCYIYIGVWGRCPDLVGFVGFVCGVWIGLGLGWLIDIHYFIFINMYIYMCVYVYIY